MGANVRPAALTPAAASSPAAALAAALAALAIAAGGAVACSSSPAAGRISVSNGGCGAGWSLAGPGWHTFQV
jgi:hypothetical protein